MRLKYDINNTIDFIWRRKYRTSINENSLYRNCNFLIFDDYLTSINVRFKERVLIWKLLKKEFINDTQVSYELSKLFDDRLNSRDFSSYRLSLEREEILVKAIIINNDKDLIKEFIIE